MNIRTPLLSSILASGFLLNLQEYNEISGIYSYHKWDGDDYVGFFYWSEKALKYSPSSRFKSEFKI